MTFPTIPTGGRVLTTNQADTSATRTFPSLSSLTKNNGDLLIAIITGTAGGTPIWSSWGAGFTEFFDRANASSHSVGAAYKWSDGTETGTFTVTQALPSGHASMILLSIPGAHASTPPEGATSITITGDPPSLDPAGWGPEDTLWIAVCGDYMTSGTGSWTGTGGTAPTNYSSLARTATVDNSTVGQCELAVAFRQLTASSDDPTSFSAADTTNAEAYATTFAVRPAPSGVTARTFDGSNDVVTTSIGNSNLTGDFTIAVLARKNSSARSESIITLKDSGGTARIQIDASTLNGVVLTTGGASPTDTAVGWGPEDGYSLFAITKTAGTTTPRTHFKPWGGAWVHTNMSATTGNPTTQSGGSIVFAASGLSGVNGLYDFAVAGTWNVALSDAQTQELMTNLKTADWKNNSGGTPLALWDFNQAAISTPVADLVGSANETSHTETTVSNDGPLGWTYGLPPGKLWPIRRGVMNQAVRRAAFY